MKSVTAQFEQGSVWDPRLLLFGALLIIGAFVSSIESDIWKGTDSLLFPLLAIGVSFVALDILLRLVRPKLKLTLFEARDNLLKVRPIKNIQFSGWVASDPVKIEISAISNVKAYDFYNVANKAGMQWVCLELKDNQVIEFHFDNPDLLAEIIEFVKTALPTVELIVDPKTKT